MVATGVLIGHDTASVTLIVIGAGMFFIGMLIPTLTEFQVGPTGFSAKLRERDLDFSETLGPDAEQLTRLGAWLAGSPEAGRELAEKALSDVYMRWSRGPDSNPLDDVRRRMVKSAPPAAPAPTGASAASSDLLSKLLALPVAERSAVVLHLLEGVDENRVAAITRREPASVAADVARGAARIIGSDVPPRGAATP